MPVSFHPQELVSAEVRASRRTNLRIDAPTPIREIGGACCRSPKIQHGHGDVRSKGQLALDTSQDAGRISDGVR
jgi:hypothetical protein